MSTKRSEAADWLINEWQHNCGYKSAVFSGFEPDPSHLRTGGYHCSINDLIAHGNGSDYSNSRPDDHGYNPAYGSAIDMSMNPSDMVLCYNRVRAVYDDKTDPRRKYVNAINCYDGSGDASRIDFYANVIGFADAGHRWHNHAEFRRRWNTDMFAAKAIASMLRGQSKSDWTNSQTVFTTEASVKNLVLAKVKGSAAVYVGDGITARTVNSWPTAQHIQSEMILRLTAEGVSKTNAELFAKIREFATSDEMFDFIGHLQTT